jgi:type II secretory pathway component PulK
MRRMIIKNTGKNRNRGVVLIITLWMVTVLTMIAYSLAYEMRLEVRVTRLKKDNLIAYHLAKAGLAKAICDLKNDMVIDRAEKSEMLDAEGDVWKNPEDKLKIELGKGTWSVKIIDEESLINLNKAHPILIEEAIKYFYEDDLDDDLAEDLQIAALAIYDWRDQDDKPGDGSIESEKELYEKYIAEDMEIDPDDPDSGINYRLKNDLFTSVEEILDVYGVSPDLFYGFDPEERKEEILIERLSRERRDNIHVMTGSSYDDSLDGWWNPEPEGLRDMLTINSSGYININTAGKAVLTALIAATRIGSPDPEDLAEAIIDYRRGGADDDIDNDKAFRNVGELSLVEGLSGGHVSRIKSFQKITVSSSNFRIIAEGNFGRAHRTIEAVVRRTWETFNVDTEDEDYDDTVKRRIKREDKDDDDGKITVECPTVRIIQWRER